MKIYSIFFYLIFTLSIEVGFSQVQEKGRSVFLNGLVEEALQNNLEIKSAERRWRAYLERPTQVSTLPDPLFSYSRFGANVETRVGPQENVFTLSQRIPFPGKLGLKGKMAQQDALTQEQQYEATKRDVVFKLKQAYYDLYWVDQSIVILNQYLALLEDFTRVAEQKYATGQGIQAHVLKSQVEISTTLERKLGFEAVRHGLSVRINALLNRPQNGHLATAANMDTTRSMLDEQALVVRALSQREELQSLHALISKSKFMQGLARKEYWPDFNLRAEYIDIPKGVSLAPDAGKNAWSVTVELNLPIWLGKRNAAMRQAEKTIAANQFEYENLKIQVEAEIRHIYNQLEVSQKTLDLYEQGLMAQAESSLESSMASYRTGRLDFLNLLDAERMLLNVNLGYVKEQSSYQKQLAALERSVGGELPE